MLGEIEKLSKEFLEMPFPEGLRGEEIQGIELVLLDSDTNGFIDRFISNRGRLNRYEFKLLQVCIHELGIVTKELNGYGRLYFSTLWTLTSRVAEFLKSTNNFFETPRDEKLLKDWRDDFEEIRKVLNEWDPLGVADSVDDEYDGINFLAYSALKRTGKLDDIKQAIKKYVEDTMELRTSVDELNEVGEKILKVCKSNNQRVL